MKRLVLLAIGLAMFSLAGCATMITPVTNMANVKNVDFSQDMKRGQSCANFILGFIGPFGNASIVEAAKNAQISKVKVVDYKSTWYLVLAQRCVVVYGQK